MHDENSDTHYQKWAQLMMDLVRYGSSVPRVPFLPYATELRTYGGPSPTPGKTKKQGQAQDRHPLSLSITMRHPGLWPPQGSPYRSVTGGYRQIFPIPLLGGNLYRR